MEIERGDHPGVLSFHLVKDGSLVAAGVERAGRTAPDLRSATKSVTALLVGIALESGKIPSLQSRVVDLLPEYRELLQKDPRKAAITVEDLLTMRSGLDCDDWQPGSPGHEDTMYEQRDWLAFWARVPAREQPGQRFSYCTGNVIALGAIVARASGMGLDDFAAQHLFKPLGIESAKWASWNRGKGIDSGGHLRLLPGDFAADRRARPGGRALAGEANRVQGVDHPHDHGAHGHSGPHAALRLSVVDRRDLAAEPAQDTPADGDGQRRQPADRDAGDLRRGGFHRQALQQARGVGAAGVAARSAPAGRDMEPRRRGSRE